MTKGFTLLGYFDSEGYLYITGRIKNILISGGQNIYPEEIEEIILTHDSVQDVYVYGQEHPLLGEIPVADVVMRDAHKVDELLIYLNKKISRYKIPSRFNIVDKIDKTYNGKIKRTK